MVHNTKITTINTVTNDLVDATDEPIASHAKAIDPTLAVIVALENEMQQVYSNNRQALDAAHRQLRSAVRVKGN